MCACLALIAAVCSPKHMLWFEAAVLVRKAALAFIATLVADAFAQVASVSVLLIASLVLQLLLVPYERPLHNLLRDHQLRRRHADSCHLRSAAAVQAGRRRLHVAAAASNSGGKGRLASPAETANRVLQVVVKNHVTSPPATGKTWTAWEASAQTLCHALSCHR